MCGIAHKALLVVQQVTEPAHDVVGGVYQRLQLARRVRRGDGREVALRPGLQLGTEPSYRARGALHHHEHHKADHGQQQSLAPKRVKQDFSG